MPCSLALGPSAGEHHRLVPAGTYPNLEVFRERHVRFPIEFVARKTGLDVARLHAIEKGDAASVYELDRLAALYGIDDADQLAEEPIRLSEGDSLTVLALHTEFQETSNESRAAILRAGQAARDVVALRQLVEASVARPALRPPVPRKGATAFDVGKERAKYLREKLEFGTQPIASMRDLVRDHFPGFVVLYAHLAEDVSGLAFGDSTRGPTIVLNLDGKNTNPLVRRFSLAHELAHLLFDWNRQAAFGQLSGFKEPLSLETEQRANAFAMRFLCPEGSLKVLAKQPDPTLVLAAKWGVHFEAARLYLSKAAMLEVPSDPSAAVLNAHARRSWLEAEDPELTGFPLDQTPPERRSIVAQLAAKAYSRGSISRDRFARYLGTTPAADVEMVLDFYSLDRPE